jgi:two-component sensor histidine kinase
LYKYSYKKDITIPLNKRNTILNERITALCTTADKLIWIATSGNGIVIVKDDSVLLHISEKDGIINNSCRSLIAAKPGQVWLGTVGGISIVNYKLLNGKLNYIIQNLSVNDGLPDNVVNDMVYQNDTVYAATGNGISIIPDNIFISKFNIPLLLIGLTINQKENIIADKYDLKYDEQNIQMQFAGIELSGHFKNLQYSSDKNKNWIDLFENTLTLQLNSGKHTINVRAVDVNGNVSDKVLSIVFNIATPFWKAAWFWITAAIVLQILTIFLVIRWQKKRKKTKLAKDLAVVQNASLEQQAFTSLMNPHFMFNALNSIQHYINLQDRKNANRYLSDFASLIRKNFEAAQKSFIPLEQELENLKIYLRLEQMRFTNRFSYYFNVDDTLDTDDWMVPTMMLQPLLENALLHGIMPSTINGELVIDIKQQDKNLSITIIDNGIGIENSRVFKQTNNHKSHGMELIIKRIDALSHFISHPINFNMMPAFDNEKNPGNKITIIIPDDLYKAWLQVQQQ